VNNRAFAIERSSTGTDWTTIGEVAAGNCPLSNCSYAFLDPSVPDGKVYYRLRQEDLDGQINYSPIRTVTYQPNQVLFQLNSANPSSSAAPIELNYNGNRSFSGQLQIFALNGSLLYQSKFVQLEPGQVWRAPHLSLATGFYHIVIPGDVIPVNPIRIAVQ
jgi:hypothetical protein